MSDPYRVYKAKVMTGVWEDLMLGREDVYDQDHPYGRKWARNWLSYKDVINRINTAAINNGISAESGLKPLLISTIYKIIKDMRKKFVTPNEIEITKGLAIRYCVEMGNKEENCKKFIEDVIGMTTTVTVTIAPSPALTQKTTTRGRGRQRAQTGTGTEGETGAQAGV